jgi:HlyD family secretion protein
MTRTTLVRVALGLVAAAIVLRFTVFRGGRTSGDLGASGTVEGTEAQLGFETPGQIEAVLVHEGDRVTVGMELARLDTAQLAAQLAQSRAAAAAARARLRELEAGARPEELEQARAAARAAADRYADAQRDFDRLQRLLQGGAVSQEAFDKAQLALAVAKSQRDQADQQLQLVAAGPRAETIAAQRAAVAEADAAVHQVEVALAGVVTVRNGEPGETVGAAGSVLTVLNLADRWVRIYIPENVMGAVKLGQPATITADTYRGKAYGGAVSFIASEAEFTPRNVQTTEERVKLVYAVKVRITGDPGVDLKPGMPADVRLAIAPQ